MLTKADILKRVTLKQEVVTIPEWGGDVIVRELTAGEFGVYQDTITDLKGDDVKINTKEMQSALVCHALIGEDGSPIFNMKEVKDLPAKVVSKIYSVAQKLNGETPEAQEEAEKN